MPSRGLIVGTKLIVVAQVYSFVLLTANFEDVKKLAQKFVSDSLAERIAEFVAKANGKKIDMMPSNNVPKSRDIQIDSNSESDEDKETNITKESISKENMKYKSNIKRKKHRAIQSITKSSTEISNEKKDKKIKTKKSKKLKMEYIPKYNNLNDFSDDSAYNNVSVESITSYLDAGVLDKKLASDQREDSGSEYIFNIQNEPKEINIKIDTSFTLTTRKEKIEFDQYNNIKYPKAEATSDGLTLKRFLNSHKSRYRPS